MSKFIFVMMFALAAVNGWGGGGVDVGNASPKGFQGTFEIPTFDHEEEMVAHVQNILGQIQDGTLPEVKKLIAKGKCSKDSVKFTELEVTDSYRYVEKSKTLQKEFAGIVTIELKECKRPSRL